jgi:hypothetical protein
MRERDSSTPMHIVGVFSRAESAMRTAVLFLDTIGMKVVQFDAPQFLIWSGRQIQILAALPIAFRSAAKQTTRISRTMVEVKRGIRAWRANAV